MVTRFVGLFLIVLAAILLVPASWVVFHPLTFPLHPQALAYATGKLAAFVAFFIITLQYVWTDKVRVIEAFMPFDVRVAVHRSLGFLGFLVLTLHPVIVLGSYALAGIPFSLSIPLGLGFLAFVVVLVIVGTTFLSRIWGVRYETWKRIHWIAIPVLTLVFWHSVTIGSDLLAYRWLRILWIVLWGLHLLLLAGKSAHKVRAWGRTYGALEVRRESADTTSLALEKPARRFRPGQFGFLSLRLDGRWQLWHPFSISSAYSDETLSLTIKSCGDFTQRVPEVKEGDRVKLDLPYGAFSVDSFRAEKYVLVAGGVGITPIYGMLRAMHSRPSPPAVTLVYSVHHESDILFRRDLEAWFAEVPGWKLIFVVTSQPEWRGEKGRLIPDKLEGYCRGDLAGTFFLCGPLAMVWSVRRRLRRRGVPRRRIRQEQFVFLP